AYLPPQRGQRVTLERGDGPPVNDDVPGIGLQQPHYMLQRDALPGPRGADDHHRLGVRHDQREADEHGLRAEGLVQVLELDHRSSTRAQNASSTRSKTAE